MRVFPSFNFRTLSSICGVTVQHCIILLSVSLCSCDDLNGRFRMQLEPSIDAVTCAQEHHSEPLQEFLQDNVLTIQGEYVDLREVESEDMSYVEFLEFTFPVLDNMNYISISGTEIAGNPRINYTMSFSRFSFTLFGASHTAQRDNHRVAWVMTQFELDAYQSFRSSLIEDLEELEFEANAAEALLTQAENEIQAFSDFELTSLCLLASHLSSPDSIDSDVTLEDIVYVVLSHIGDEGVAPKLPAYLYCRDDGLVVLLFSHGRRDPGEARFMYTMFYSEEAIGSGYFNVYNDDGERLPSNHADVRETIDSFFSHVSSVSSE